MPDNLQQNSFQIIIIIVAFYGSKIFDMWL